MSSGTRQWMDRTSDGALRALLRRSAAAVAAARVAIGVAALRWLVVGSAAGASLAGAAGALALRPGPRRGGAA